MAAGEEGWIERTKAVLHEGGDEGDEGVNGVTPSPDVIGDVVSPAVSEQGDLKKSDEPSPTLNKTSTLRKVSVITT